MAATMNSATDRAGQAAIETALGLTVFVFIVAALVACAAIFIDDFRQLVETRREAGAAAFGAAEDVRAFRTESYALDLTLLGSDTLFPNEIRLTEAAVLPGLGRRAGSAAEIPLPGGVRRAFRCNLPDGRLYQSGASAAPPQALLAQFRACARADGWHERPVTETLNDFARCVKGAAVAAAVARPAEASAETFITVVQRASGL